MRRGEREKKQSCPIFLQCSDSRSSVALELKLVYLTRARSRYQEWKDSVLHALRGRGLSYSSSVSFKGRKWPCGLESTTGLSFRTVWDRVLKVGIRADFGVGLLENSCWTLLWPVFEPCMTGFEIGFDLGATVRNR